jgi:glycosyltransferase involved in cell wall biosynthesis
MSRRERIAENEAAPSRASVKVAISPAFKAKGNAFTVLFARALGANGHRVKEFSFRKLLSYRVVIFHWPNSFLSRSSLRGSLSLRLRLKLKLLELAHRFTGLKVVWVAHNVRPHDVANLTPGSGAAFMELLDGVVYLSNSSRAEVLKYYPALAAVPGLVTTHGHYLPSMVSPPTPRRSPASPVRLLHFGQIRPYKNIELLIECVKALPEGCVHLTVAGKADDLDLIRRLRDLANRASYIELDLRSELLSDEQLETMLDMADAVVLPYRQVLNSGAALFALSRNRPVLAPSIGSLPELRETAGMDWVHLYEGDLTTGHIQGFVSALQAEPLRHSPDLSAHDWDRIGRQLAHFVDALVHQDPLLEGGRRRPN